MRNGIRQRDQENEILRRATAYFARDVRARYLLDVDLADCWPQHASLVEELSALRASHTAAYSPDAGPSDGLLWHEALDRARSRWQRWNVTRCTRDHHNSGSATR